MQEKSDEGHQGAQQPKGQEARGVLESPEELTVTAAGVPVATFREPTVSHPFSRTKEGMNWLVHRYKELLWNQVPAQLMLQGASAQVLLGGEYILLRGEHRAPFHPQQGMDNVTVVQVLDNPRKLDIEQTFLLVAG